VLRMILRCGAGCGAGRVKPSVNQGADLSEHSEFFVVLKGFRLGRKGPDNIAICGFVNRG